MTTPQTNSSTVTLIDGDGRVYRCGFAAEKTFYLVEGLDNSFFRYDNAKAAKAALPEGGKLWTRKEVEPLEHCLATVKSSLTKTFDTAGGPQGRIFLSGKTNFREQLYPDYKANRINIPKPKYYREIREYLTNHWNAKVVDDIEADDALGIGAMECRAQKLSYVIVTQDKDLDQIPGNHYDWTTGLFQEISPEQGLRNFYSQVLTGDSTDNIKGCPGIGPAKAKTALAGCKTPQQLAETVYEVYKATLGHAPDGEVELNATLVWVQRKPNDKHPLWRHLGREAL